MGRWLPMLLLSVHMGLDPVPHICALAVQSKGGGNTWVQAGELLAQAYAVERDHARGRVSRSGPGGGHGYIDRMRRLQESYAYLVSPDNAPKLPQPQALTAAHAISVVVVSMPIQSCCGYLVTPRGRLACSASS